MLSKFKLIFSNQKTGIGLCLLALLLVGNTLYLHTVRDAKADKLESLEAEMEDYQGRLQHQHKGVPNALKPFAHRFNYGAFLRAALTVFKDFKQTLNVTDIRMQTTDVRTAPSDQPLDFPLREKKRKKKSTNPVQVLFIQGQMKTTSGASAPYQALSTAMTEIYNRTGCQLTLNKAGDSFSPSQEQPAIPPFISFELALRPKEQKTCEPLGTQAQEAAE